MLKFAGKTIVPLSEDFARKIRVSRLDLGEQILGVATPARPRQVLGGAGSPGIAASRGGVARER